jgi:hypothetical protein
MGLLRSKFLAPAVITGIARISLALCVLLDSGKIMAKECPLTSPLTLTDSQSGIAGETGTVWTVAPDCSFTVARHIGQKVLESHKQGHLTTVQQARLKSMLDRMVLADLAQPHAGRPQVNPRRIKLSYGGREAVLTLPPGGGDVAKLRAPDGDDQARAILEMATAMKDMLGR